MDQKSLEEVVWACAKKVSSYCEIGDLERARHWLSKASRLAERVEDTITCLHVLIAARDTLERHEARARTQATEMTEEEREICQSATRMADATCHYAAFEVAPNVSQEDLKATYKRLAVKFHPDKHSCAHPNVLQLCEKAFQRLSEAFRELSDPDARRRYDLKQAGNAPKRARDEPPWPQSRSMWKKQKAEKKKAEVSEWYKRFHSADLACDLTPTAYAGYCVRHMHRLASFMQQGGDNQCDWYALLCRYAYAPGKGNAPLERVLWKFGGAPEYLTLVQDMQRLFNAEDYPGIRQQLDLLKLAVEHYIAGKACVHPKTLPSDASFKEACEVFVDGVRRLCEKMMSMQDKNADWEGFLEKFPSDQASELSLKAVGVDVCERELRDFLATTDSHLVKKIATQLLVILAQVSALLAREAKVKDEDVALEKARILRQELSTYIGCEIARDFSKVKKIAKMLPVQITTKSKEACRDDIVHYFTQTFTELSLARRVWASMIEEASKSCAAAKNLTKALNELVNEKNANVWYDVLNENADPAFFLERYNSITKKFAEAVAYDGHLCDKTAKLYCEIRTELLIHLHEA